MQGTRKVANMKGRKNKLVDLPAGAKPERSLRRKQTATAIAEAINTNQSENILNKVEENIMAMTNKQATARALKSEISAMPEGMETRIDVVQNIVKSPVDFLVRHYPSVDNETITESDKLELGIAELVVKHKSGKGDNVVGEWLLLNTQTAEERSETLERAAAIIEDGMKENKSAFASTEAENVLTRRRQVAVLSSVATTALIGGAKMLMNDDFGKGEILKTVAGAAISGAVTTVTMSALSEKELSNTQSAGIGAGIGLAIGGALTFGMDMFSSDELEGPESAPAELPAPAVF